MNWYVLRVKINYENDVLEALKKRLDPEVYKPFIPKKTYPHTKGGELLNTVKKICFPGYVFIETEKIGSIVIKDTEFVISGISGVHFFLSYNDNKNEDGSQQTEYVMREAEKNALKVFLDDDFLIGPSVGFTEGERVKITSGPFVGYEGAVKSINKRRMTAVISIGMFGTIVDTTIMLIDAKRSGEAGNEFK